jgi:hypothetical protein
MRVASSIAVLVALDGLSVFSFEFQELDVGLDLMTRHLFLVSLSVDVANTRAAGQPAEAVAPENAIHAGIGDGDGVITRQIPDDADSERDAEGDCPAGSRERTLNEY